MRAGRDAMQDVEIVEGDDDLDVLDLGDPGDDAQQAEAARARRRTLRRQAVRVLRLLRRWWPVPLVLVLALVAVQVVQDRREDAAVERRQQVDGVLAGIGDRLQAREIDDDTSFWADLTAMHAGDLTLTVQPAEIDVERTVTATRDGETVWQTSVEDVPPHTTEGGASTPVCSLDEAEALLLCQVDERGAPVTTESSWSQGTVVLSRLVLLDAATGEVLDRRTVPVGATTTVHGDRVYVVSAADDVLTVEARDLATGSIRWGASLELDGSVPLGTDDGTSLWPAAQGDYLLVGVYQPTWAFRLEDGALAAASDSGLAVGRSGLLVQTGADLRRAEDGTLHSGDAISLVTPQVDDRSVDHLELLVRDSGSDAPTLVAVDAGSGDTAWSADLDGWDGYAVIVLDGTVYAAGTSEVWAIDLATGDRRWTGERRQGLDGTLLTDGRFVYTAEWQAEPMVVDGTLRQPSDSGDGARLTAHRLSDGARAREIPLPDGVTAVSMYGGVLLGYAVDGSSSTVALE
jgi:outer membrane protein assembly factor BamB